MISNVISLNIKMIQEHLGNPIDLTVRDLIIKFQNQRIAVSLVYLSGIVNEEEIEKYIINPIQQCQLSQLNEDFIQLLQKEMIGVKSVMVTRSFHEMIKNLLKGHTVIILDGEKVVLLANTVKWKERAVASPEGQRVVKGPMIGFNEHLETNISFIRKSIKSEMLSFEKYTLGTMTNTDICLAYVRNTVDYQVLQELKKRISQLHLTKILEANYLEESLSSDFITPFPLILNTDRPDVVTSSITEGKIAILVEGTPYALIVPALFVQFLQSPDDYYIKGYGILGRSLRLIASCLSIYIPAFYIAFINFHPGLLPVELLLNLASQREDKPLPLVIELLIFTFLFQMIVECSVRLPKPLALVVSILGSIIIGQSAVEAGIVQPATLLIVSISHILGFTSPYITFGTTIRILRYLYIMSASFLGLYGVILATLLLLFHLNHIRSFGIPYLAPISPFNLYDQKDSFFRIALRKITNNPNRLHHEEPLNKERKRGRR
ncbi:spore germination protein [Bacillus cereus]|nr:spore germination protein [Bacillus cereus]